jgi:hypothetical protein
MRRFARVRVQYLAAVGLAVGIGGGIYALRSSQANAPTRATAPVLTSVPPRPAAPVVASVAPPPPVRPGPAPAAKRVSRAARATPTREPVPSTAALLARARLAYANARGVVVAGTLARARLSLTFILDDDRIVADGWLGTGANGEVIGAVTPPGSPTLARELGTECWRPLAASNVLSSTDIGEKFPPLLSRTFGTPVRSRGGWSISREDSNGAFATFVIDAKTFQLRSLTSTDNGLTFSGNVAALSSAPALPVPEPRC